MTSAHILIADDDARIRDMFTIFLVRQGYRVSQADDGFDALLRLRQESIDLLIADVNMPGLGGLDLTRRLRGRPETANLPVILISGVIDGDDTQHAIEAGADACFDKAGDLKLLAATIANLQPSKASGTDILNSGPPSTSHPD